MYVATVELLGPSLSSTRVNREKLVAGADLNDRSQMYRESFDRAKAEKFTDDFMAKMPAWKTKSV
jgi:hypothetical protein